jgi:hypothetical protein
MAHASNLITDIKLGDPLAFFNIPLCPRNGALDGPCADCQQHGQWNVELDLVSFRCKRAICDTCYGAGWVETGNDARAIPDIVLSESGHPQWILRYFPGR